MPPGRSPLNKNRKNRSNSLLSQKQFFTHIENCLQIEIKAASIFYMGAKLPFLTIFK